MSPLGRCLALLTPTGRARRRLWQAVGSHLHLALGGEVRNEDVTPEDRRRTDRVARALAALGRRPQTPPVRAVARDMLCYLVWTSLRHQALDDAARWLGQLDAGFPDFAPRLSARWDLMNSLLGAGGLDAYAAEAARLLADPLVRRDAHSHLVLEAVRTVYERASPAACEGVVAAAHRELADTRQLQAALALCRCPADFRSAEDARTWAGRVDSDKLRFSKRMRADALVVAARAAEWAGDWGLMEARAGEALGAGSHLHLALGREVRNEDVTPGHEGAGYWLARARLHEAGRRPAEHLDLGRLPAGPAWARLVQQVRAYQEPSLANARELLPVLRGDLGALIRPEETLTTDLLRQALTRDTALAPEHVASSAEVAIEAERVVGRMPWAEIVVALREVQLDRRYSAAVERLEKPDIARDPSVRALARVARLLAGSPLPPDPAQGSDAIGVLEAAAHRVLGMGSHLHLAPGGPGRNEDVTPRGGAKADAALWAAVERAREDAACRRFPELAAAADALAFGLRAVAGDPGLGAVLLAHDPPSHTPRWAMWLLARLALACCPPARLEEFLGKVDVSQPAIAWFIESWWRNLSRSGLPSARTREQVGAALKRAVPDASGASRSCVARVRGARAAGYRMAELGAKPGAMPQAFSELGSLCEGVCAWEAAFEMGYAVARAALARGEARLAIAEFTKLRDALGNGSALSALAWSPSIAYWLGVAAAHAGDRAAARTTLREAVGTLKDAEARSQLALLAVQDGELGDAARWLEGAPDDVPGVLYARAVLLSRSGSPGPAFELLDAGAASVPPDAAPYGLAIRRLAAALCERGGAADEAEKRHRGLLAQAPGDATTSARLGRLLLRRAYAPKEAEAISPDPAILELLRAGARVARWPEDYALLHRLVVAEKVPGTFSAPALLDELKAHLAGRGKLAWQQACARRLLEAARAEDAYTLLGGSDPIEGPAWLARTRQILRAWRALTTIWGTHSVANVSLQEAKRCRKDIEPLVSHLHFAHGGNVPNEDVTPPDAVLRRWATLLDWAVAAGAAAGPGGKGSWYLFRPQGEAGAGPFWHVVGCWCPDPAARARAAASLAATLDGQAAPWTPAQQELLRAVTAWLLGQDDACLASYRKLLPQLGELPVDGRHLWLGAATIWFARKNWAELLTGELPPCVEDLSLPEARLLMGLAYARAAAESADKAGKTADAATKVRQAREMLSTLIATADNQGV